MALIRVLRYCVGAIAVGALSVAITISFAALIYNGDLAHLFGGGLSFILLGAGVLTLVCGFTLSTRGAVAMPQDITALLIGAAAAGLAVNFTGPEQALATIVLLILISTLVAGLTVFAVGYFQWGALVRYIPYPVLAGFLAANGYLLFMGGLSIATGQSANIGSVLSVVSSVSPLLWLPWLAGAVLLIILERTIKQELTLPTFLIVAVTVFYGICWYTGTSLEKARALGFLLATFTEGGFAQSFDPGIMANADFSVLPGQIPVFVAVAGLAVLGALLNTSGLELSRNMQSDTDADMRATGVANLAAGAFGGLPGYSGMSTTLVAYRLGLTGFWPGLFASAGILTTFIFGAQVVSFLPVGFLALIVMYIGVDLVWSWLWRARKQLTRLEYGVVILIVAIAAIAGFLPALGVGTLAAAAIFVGVYSQTSVVRVETSAARRRSRVERSDAANTHLVEQGYGTAIFELSGYLFFGTASRLEARAVDVFSGPNAPHTLLLDFARVSGIDASAASSLLKIARAAQASDANVIFTGVNDQSWSQIQRIGPEAKLLGRHATLDAALEAIEEETLARFDVNDESHATRLIEAVRALEEAIPGEPEAVTRLTLKAGDRLIAEGDSSEDIYVLLDGGLRAEIAGPDGVPLRVAQVRPYTMVGEIAHYAGVARTAALVADAPSELVRINLARIGDRAESARADLHSAAAQTLARRVIQMNALIRDAGL